MGVGKRTVMKRVAQCLWLEEHQCDLPLARLVSNVSMVRLAVYEQRSFNTHAQCDVEMRGGCQRGVARENRGRYATVKRKKGVS